MYQRQPGVNIQSCTHFSYTHLSDTFKRILLSLKWVQDCNLNAIIFRFCRDKGVFVGIRGHPLYHNAIYALPELFHNGIYALRALFHKEIFSHFRATNTKIAPPSGFNLHQLYNLIYFKCILVHFNFWWFFTFLCSSGPMHQNGIKIVLIRKSLKFNTFFQNPSVTLKEWELYIILSDN